VTNFSLYLSNYKDILTKTAEIGLFFPIFIFFLLPEMFWEKQQENMNFLA